MNQSPLNLIAWNAEENDQNRQRIIINMCGKSHNSTTEPWWIYLKRHEICIQPKIHSRDIRHTYTQRQWMTVCLLMIKHQEQPGQRRAKQNQTEQRLLDQRCIYGNRCELTVNKMNGKQRFQGCSMHDAWWGQNFLSLDLDIYTHFFCCVHCRLRFDYYGCARATIERMKKGKESNEKTETWQSCQMLQWSIIQCFHVTNNSQQITHATRIEHKNALPTYMMPRGWVPIRWYWMWASLSICIYVPISLSSSSSAHFVRVPVNCAARSYVARVASAVYVLVSDFFVSFCVLISCQR